MSGASPVSLERQGDIGVITVNYPPVNALGPGVAEGIKDCLARGNTDPAIKAMVLIGAGRSFIAGADIRGFGTNRPRLPLGQRVYDVLDASEKPVVAAIHGYALGGGLEIAMACHYRIALPSAKVGLPEVLIGILPGGGGTQRLPRLIGAKAALDMIVTGRHVPAPEAKKLGIIDEVLPESADLRESAIAYAMRIVRRAPAAARARSRGEAARTPACSMRCASRSPAARATRRRPITASPRSRRRARCRSTTAAGARPICSRSWRTPPRRARCATRSSSSARWRGCPTFRPTRRLRDFTTAAVVGAGTMGGGIAMSFADFGFPVKIMDATPEALDRGMQRIRDNYATSVRRGTLAEDEMQRRLARIEPVAGYDDIADCDLVIEAVFEEMDVKKPMFAKLDEVMKPGALLFSNTSALDIDQLAEMTKRPQDVAGTHFFSPANVMKLLEVVRGTKSSPQTLATAMQMGRRIGKLSAMAGNTDGFVANRSRAPFNTEMVILLEEGCLPEQVDKVMVDFGYPMGPFAVGDLAGLDIGYASRKRRAAENPNLSQAADRRSPGGDGPLRPEDRRRLVSLREGRPHAASRSRGRRHHQGGRRRDSASRSKSFTDEEILHRLLFSSVNEACKILEEGKAYRASDIDVMWLHGFGFPRYRGGLLFWADGIGVREVYNQIASWHQQYGERWAPSRLLRELAESGTPFREAKAAASCHKGNHAMSAVIDD